jgi:hypothetical protein
MIQGQANFENFTAPGRNRERNVDKFVQAFTCNRSSLLGNQPDANDRLFSASLLRPALGLQQAIRGRRLFFPGSLCFNGRN